VRRTSLPSRRQFVRSCCTLGAAGAAWRLSRFGLITANAQTAGNYKALVCVYMSGGNDGNNTVVPLGATEYQQYATGRSVLAIPAASLLPVPASGAPSGYGLHPQFTRLQPLYLAKKAALVFNVGTLVRPTTRVQYRGGGNPVPKNLFSHSDQTNQWQTGNTAGSGGTGWGGRVIDLMQSLNTSTFPSGVSVAGSSALLNGAASQSINVSPGSRFGIDSFGSTAGDQARQLALQQILTFDTGVSLVGSASAVTSSALKTAQDVNAAINGAPALTTVFPNTGLGQQLSQVASIIQVRAALGMNRQIFFCNMGGYDNHTDLLPNQVNLFGQLDPALAAFYAATQELGVDQSVTSFTESEFGRTFQPSTGQGSDHAWGSHHIVLGGAVRGGEAYGKFPTLRIGGDDDTDNRGVWIPTLSLDQYAATLASWFGVAPGSLTAVFPNLANFTTSNLGFV
jgi:uncharacterized protein (DUF1501 family)